jgi:VCBS repeat-containing protein
VAVTGDGLVTGNNGTTWAPANDSGTGTPRQGFPFIIEGTPGCAAGDIPWVAASPTSGTTGAGAATDVDVVFDSTGLTGGVYTGTLCVTSDDPVTPLVEVSLELTVENSAPVAVGDSYTTTQDMALNVPAPGVLDNDSDPDGDDLTAVLDTDVSNGSLTLNSDGSFTYTPAPGYSGADGFTYHANDGTANSNTVTVVIDVVATEHILYLPVVRKAETAQAQMGTDVAAGENWLSIALAAFPMMVGMWFVYRRNGRFDG